MAHGRVSTKMASLAAGKSRRFLDLGGGTQDSAAAFPALSGALSGQGVSGDLELRGLPRRRSVLVSIASILYRQFSLLVALRKWGQAEIQPFNVFATLGVGLLRLGGVCARCVFANPPRTDFFATFLARLAQRFCTCRSSSFRRGRFIPSSSAPPQIFIRKFQSLSPGPGSDRFKLFPGRLLQDSGLFRRGGKGAASRWELLASSG